MPTVLVLLDEVDVRVHNVFANKKLDASDGSASWYILLVGLTKSWCWQESMEPRETIWETNNSFLRIVKQWIIDPQNDLSGRDSRWREDISFQVFGTPELPILELYLSSWFH